MKSYALMISGILLLAVIVRLICFVGLIGSDDLNYNRSAYDLAVGTFSSQLDHQRTRLGLVLPVAGMFKLFGVNEWSSVVFSFFYFMVTFGVLVYVGTTFFSKWTGIIAGLLYTFLPLEIFHATILLPDLPSAACIALSGTILYQVDKHSQDTKPLHSQHPRIGSAQTWGYLFLGGFTLGWAYLIRETALFLVVFVGGYMVSQALIRKTIQWSWLGFWIGFLTIIGAELGYYYWMTGNPFYRTLSITASITTAIENLPLQRYFYGVSSLWEYLSFDRLRVLFSVPDFSFYYFFVFAGAIYGIHKRIAHLRYFIGWFLTLFLLYNFASKSISTYTPFRSVPRYFLTLSVPGILIMSVYIQEMAHILLVKTKKHLLPFWVPLMIAWMLGFVINFFWFSVIRLLFLGFIGALLLLLPSETLRTWFQAQISPKQIRIMIPVIFLYINILPGIYMVAKGERPRTGISCERDIRPLLEFPLTHTIYTDGRTEAILEYFYQYQYDHQIKSYDERQTPGETCSDIETWENAYVIVNWERLFFLNRVYNTPIPQFLFHPCPHWKRLAQLGGEVNPCLIYEIP